MINYELLITLIFATSLFFYQNCSQPFQINNEQSSFNSTTDDHPKQDSLTSEASQKATGPLRVSTINPRYFTDGSGKAIYLTGSHTWANLQDVGFTQNPLPFNFEDYLDFLNKYNHNFIRLFVFESARTDESNSTSLFFNTIIYLRTGVEVANDGGQKFDLNKFNQLYFDRLRERVKLAQDRGIYVGVMLFEGWSVWNRGPNRFSWKYHPYNISNNINGINGDLNGNQDGDEIHSLQAPAILNLQKLYIRKVIDTLNDLDNVLYEISNEDDITASDWQNHLINDIKNYQKTKPKQHPVGKTGIGMGASNDLLFNSPADWISPVRYKEGKEDVYCSDMPLPTTNKVILLDTDHLSRSLYEEDGTFARNWVWKSFTRGYNPIYMEVLPNSRINIEDYYASWSDTPLIPARHAMGDTLSFAKKMDLAAMAPDETSCSTTFCLVSEGKEYLIYQPHSTMTFSVYLLSGIYEYEWFNPITGLIVTTGTFSVNSDSSKSFQAPFSGDSVLYIKSK